MDHDLIQPRWFQPLREAIRRSIFVLVVGVPLLPVCWYATHDLPIGNLSLGIYIAVAAVLVACEYALSFHEGWGTAIKGNITDFIYVGVGSATEKATFVLCATLMASLGRTLADFFEVAFWPSQWYFGFQLLLALMIADVATYFRHRLFHSYDPLWRFHQIHHSATGLYWIRSAYTHPLEQFAIMIAIMLPISFLGAGDGIIVVVVFVYGLSGLIQHANIDARSSILNRIFATSEVHRFHHGANAKGNASNYSAFFVFMDMLFGTYAQPELHEAPRKVGLEGVKIFPGNFFRHLVLPFQRDPDGIELDDEWTRAQPERREVA